MNKKQQEQLNKLLEMKEAEDKARAAKEANRTATGWDSAVGAKISLVPIKDSIPLPIWNEVDESIWSFLKWSKLSTETSQLYIQINSSLIPVSVLPTDSGMPLIEALTAIKTKQGCNLLEWINNRFQQCIEAFEKSITCTDFLTKYTTADLYKKANEFFPASILGAGLVSIISRESKGTEDIKLYHGLTICRENSKKSMLAVSIYDLEIQEVVARAVRTRRDHMIANPVPYSSVMEEPAICHFDLEAHSAVTGLTPAWDEYLQRFKPNQAEIFMAAHYARLNSTNKSRQAVWLYDDGGKGKSVYCDVIQRVLTQAVTENGLPKSCVPVLNFTEFSDKTTFFHQQLISKSFIFFRDCMLASVTHQNWFRNITGGDAMNAEMKFKNGTVEISHRIKILICSNKTPDVNTSAMRDTSRIILLKQNVPQDIVEKITFSNGALKGDPSFANRLFAEHDFFLAKCKEAYLKRCPTDANIDVTGNESDFDLSDEEACFARFIDERCTTIDSAKTTWEKLKLPIREYLEKDLGRMFVPVKFMSHFEEFCKKYYPKITFVETKSKSYHKITGLDLLTEKHFRKVSGVTNPVAEEDECLPSM